MLNNDTGRRHKRIVPIRKRLENELVADGALAEVPSYLIECLVYNVANNRIRDWQAALFDGSYHRSLSIVVQDAYQQVAERLAVRMVEVNEIKPLFGDEQPWTWQQARAFLDAAWNVLDLARAA